MRSICEHYFSVSIQIFHLVMAGNDSLVVLCWYLWCFCSRLGRMFEDSDHTYDIFISYWFLCSYEGLYEDANAERGKKGRPSGSEVRVGYVGGGTMFAISIGASGTIGYRKFM